MHACSRLSCVFLKGGMLLSSAPKPHLNCQSSEVMVLNKGRSRRGSGACCGLGPHAVHPDCCELASARFSLGSSKGNRKNTSVVVGNGFVRRMVS